MSRWMVYEYKGQDGDKRRKLIREECAGRIQDYFVPGMYVHAKKLGTVELDDPKNLVRSEELVSSLEDLEQGS